MNLGREVLRDLLGLLTAGWVFLLIVCFVYGWYQSYALIDSFTREQKWPSGRLKKAFAYIVFQLSPEKSIEMYFSPNVSTETKLHRSRLYFSFLYFLAMLVSGFGLFYLWHLVNSMS